VTALPTSSRSEISEMALSHAFFASMQVYIPWLAASRAPLPELAMLSLAQSVVWPLAMLCQLQLRHIYLAQGDRSLLPRFVVLQFAGCLLLPVAGVTAAAILQPDGFLLAVALALALVKSLEGAADIVHAELLRARNGGAAWRSQTFRCAIFIALYTAGLLTSDNLLAALSLAIAGVAAWVVLVDLRPHLLGWAVLRTSARLSELTPTFKAGISLSCALALSSLALMVGRWAAARAGDVEAVAAATLAATMASAVALLFGAAQQLSITDARGHLVSGGIAAFRASMDPVSRRLHLLFAGLGLAWLTAAVVASQFALPLPTRNGGHGLQQIVLVLAGCYLAAGWMAVLCFNDTLLLALQRRHRVVLLIALAQVATAAGLSVLLYPWMGWTAIGVAEVARGLTFLAAVKYAARQLP